MLPTAFLQSLSPFVPLSQSVPNHVLISQGHHYLVRTEAVRVSRGVILYALYQCDTLKLHLELYRPTGDTV